MTTACMCGCRHEDSLDLSLVDKAVAEHGKSVEALIPLLQAIQRAYRYLPAEALHRLCEITEITPAQLTGVATFYTQFRHQPVGKHIISICHGTACHVKGSERIHDAIARHLSLAEGADTDAQGRYTIERVACLGCCTLAPVIQIDQVTYGHLSGEDIPGVLNDFLALQQKDTLGTSATSATGALAEIRVGAGSCCIAGGSQAVREALELAVREYKARAVVKPVGCGGICHRAPMVEIAVPGMPPAVYVNMQPEDAGGIIARHFRPRGIFRALSVALSRSLDNMLTDETWEPVTRYAADTREDALCDFVGKQVRVATEHGGQLDPLDLDEYLRHDGFTAAREALCAEPGKIVARIKDSGLRGRGGGGFPSGEKWAAVREAGECARGDARAPENAEQFVICNGDEGDPGAFMDRMLLESFPFRVIEGMIIAAFAVGAHKGIFYIRAEYPLAVRRVREAIARCEERGLLGDSCCGADFSFRLRVVEGAGAFVCGEETALIASLEGGRGIPTLRPPYPSASGLHSRPTLVNNVETFANVPWILRHGDDFARLGTAGSRGTKVFALTGKIRRGGLIEVPMGITIREIVEEIGGGIAGGRKFKAVQIGGPSGGCLPARLADTPVDFAALSAHGAIMGSGGLVVLDERDCMVDLARYFLSFTQAQSCGKCTFCRIGTRRMLDILERICAGEGDADDLDRLEALAHSVQQGSLCGLGRTAPNPVLTTLRYFRQEYEAHLEGRCPAGKCLPLIRYRVTERCIGCTRCAQACPVEAIPLVPFKRAVIDDVLCTRCDSCRAACPQGAIIVE